MGQPPRRSLTAEDGAEFLVTIEELDDGQWQASARVHVDSKSHVETQSIGIELFPSEAKAREWIKRAAAARGFKKLKLNVRRLK